MSDAFRRGFLYGLASCGMTPEAFGNHLKQAQVLHAMGSLLDLGAAGLVAAPLGVGALAGSLYAKATAPDYNDSLKKEKQTELLRQLRLATRQLMSQQAAAQPGATGEPNSIPTPAAGSLDAQPAGPAAQPPAIS